MNSKYLQAIAVGSKLAHLKAHEVARDSRPVKYAAMMRFYLIIVCWTGALLYRWIEFMVNSNGTITLSSQPPAIAIDEFDRLTYADTAQIAIALCQRPQIIRPFPISFTTHLDVLHRAF